jgi:hypothetical protein
VSIGQDDFALFQLPQLQLDGDVLRVGELDDAANHAHLVSSKGVLPVVNATARAGWFLEILLNYAAKKRRIVCKQAGRSTRTASGRVLRRRWLLRSALGQVFIQQ